VTQLRQGACKVFMASLARILSQRQLPAGTAGAVNLQQRNGAQGATFSHLMYSSLMQGQYQRCTLWKVPSISLTAEPKRSLLRDHGISEMYHQIGLSSNSRRLALAITPKVAHCQRTTQVQASQADSDNRRRGLGTRLRKRLNKRAADILHTFRKEEKMKVEYASEEEELAALGEQRYKLAAGFKKTLLQIGVCFIGKLLYSDNDEGGGCQ
jgi:hypothetical protein